MYPSGFLTPPTGSWDKWDTAYVVLDAPMGEADLRFISLTADGGPNIDAFGFSLDGVCRVGVDCTTTKWVKTSAVAKAQIRGDMLVLTDRADVRVFDANGLLVARKSLMAGEMDLSKMVRSNGLYRVIVKQGNSKFVATWVKVK